MLSVRLAFPPRLAIDVLGNSFLRFPTPRGSLAVFAVEVVVHSSIRRSTRRVRFLEAASIYLASSSAQRRKKDEAPSVPEGSSAPLHVTTSYPVHDPVHPDLDPRGACQYT